MARAVGEKIGKALVDEAKADQQHQAKRTVRQWV
jgi:hypothetical protein